MKSTHLPIPSGRAPSPAIPGYPSRCSPHEQGSSLLEILVALLLISLGMLGIAGLAGSTMSYNKASQFRLTGLALANDYADHARLNIYGFDLGDYKIALDDTAPTKPTIDLEEADTATAASNVATADKADFMSYVANRLPGGKAVVVANQSTSERGLDIWLLWEEAETATGDTLFASGQQNCPNSLSADDVKIYSCMYFKVGL